MKIIKQILFFILFIIIDLALWIIIGLVILNYEDFYDESKGKYFSLSSMTTIEKIAYFSYYIWIILNVVLIIYFAYRLIKKYVLKL
ncbi:hypothetical protein [uncultured Algibacter sp.]|uniref:hypothetical protein n=1 Tax=uncultured Algibacter sp. TaxID=298659 RepID=UPI002629BBBB|nr:hypothetical protein [uncultured Algibacter sp.]